MIRRLEKNKKKEWLKENELRQKKGTNWKMKVNKKQTKLKTWRLIYPNKEESITNYDPIIEERKWAVKEVLKLIKSWDGYGEDRFPEGEVKELVREIKKLRNKK